MPFEQGGVLIHLLQVKKREPNRMERMKRPVGEGDYCPSVAG
jgi:hypothetical protein